MDFSYFKYMNYINKHKRIDFNDLIDEFDISYSESLELLKSLSDDGYITIERKKYVPTIKGKHFIKSFILTFINVNIINILALIVSIFAFIEATISLISK